MNIGDEETGTVEIVDRYKRLVYVRVGEEEREVPAALLSIPCSTGKKHLIYMIMI